MKIFVFDGAGSVKEVRGSHKFSSLVSTMINDTSLYVSSPELLEFARAQEKAAEVATGHRTNEPQKAQL